MKKIIFLNILILFLFTQCNKEESYHPDTTSDLVIEQEIQSTILCEQELFNDPVFLQIIGEVGEIDDNMFVLKSGNSEEKQILKLDYKKIRKIKKDKYESFTFLVDELDRSTKFTNLVLESDGNSKNALLLDYYPTQDVIKKRKLGFKTKFEGQLNVTRLDLNKIQLKSYSCLYITVYEGCPNPACDGSPGCLWGCDGGTTSTTYSYCFNSGSDGSSIPADPNSPPPPGGGGSSTSTVDPYFNPELNAHIQYLNDLLQIELTGPADIVIDKTYIIDLQTFLQQSKYVCWDRSGGVYYMCEGHWIYVRNNQYYVDLTGQGDWGKAVLGTHKLSNEISSLIGSSVLAGAQFIGTYFLPVEGFYILITGEDFKGLESNRFAAGTFLILEVLPGGKVLKPVANLLGTATKFFFKYGDDFLDLVKVNNVIKFTDNTIKQLAKAATKNANSNKVILGKYIENSLLSYEQVARAKGYCFYELDNWNEFKSLINNSEEMWKVNKEFIDNQIDANKKFYFSHNPNTATDTFKKEVDYLKSRLGITDFILVGDLWTY